MQSSHLHGRLAVDQMSVRSAPSLLECQLRYAAGDIDVVGGARLGNHAGLVGLLAVGRVEVDAGDLVDGVDVLDDVGAEVGLLRDIDIVAVAARQRKTIQCGFIGRTWGLCSRWTCRSSRRTRPPGLAQDVRQVESNSDGIHQGPKGSSSSLTRPSPDVSIAAASVALGSVSEINLPMLEPLSGHTRLPVRVPAPRSAHA
jgi:hypothetical protein